MEYEVKTKEEALNLLKGIAASIAQQEVDAAKVATQFSIDPKTFEKMVTDAMALAMFGEMQRLLMEPLLKKFEEKSNDEDDEEDEE